MTASVRCSRRAPASVAAALVLLAGLAAPASAQPRRAVFESEGRYLVLEALDDDLIHFELAAGTAPDAIRPLESSLMVHRRAYPGPGEFASTARSVQTGALRVEVDPATLCFTSTDLDRGAALTTVCPRGLDGGEPGLSLTRGATEHVYGLGEQFVEPGDPHGDWVGRERVPGDEYGNKMVGFNGGAVGNAMFPVMYAVGGEADYALFLDNVYAQRWDFRADPWRVTARGGTIRGYLMAGPDLRDLRRDYMELTGAPPVPPKKAFGLWVSEYGYDSWAELDDKLRTLRAARFPLDGFVMDLQWFGGITSDSDSTSMGRLEWDREAFPDPEGRIERLRRDEGLALMVIEESYVGRALAEHDSLESRGYLARQRPGGPATYLDYNPWWGKGGMIDWTSDLAGAYWHDWKRQPLVDMGIIGHWTDLGEPELYDADSWYHGVVPGAHDHEDVHNLYNLKWSQSIHEGYRRNGVLQRPFIMSRSGTSGSQRFGVAMWSGDIGANLSSLATHLNAQGHVAMSGIDYFGSDIGGFHRASVQGDPDEMYTQWFAAGALLDVPVRAHTENLCNCKETAPDRIGHVASNLANIRLRYELAPYYYSLAHRAHRYAEPLVAPLVYHHPDDAAVREIGDHKLIGRDLLAAPVALHGAERRDVYLPRGRWVDVYTNAWHTSAGEWLRDVPLRREGLFRVPLYARAGAILPMMHVDGRTMNVDGRRTDGSHRDDLVVRVFPDPEFSAFVLYEDDGRTIAYQEGELARTVLSQRRGARGVTVTVGAREGRYRGAPDRRANLVELVVEDRPVTAVSLNGTALVRHASRAELDAAESGWFADGDALVLAKSGALPVGQRKRFVFRF